MPTRHHRATVLVYLVATTLLSAIFWRLMIRDGHVGAGGGLYVLGLMWSPAVAALVTIRICRLGWASLGLRWGGTRYAVRGYLIPLAYAAIAYGFTWSLGLGSFPNHVTIAALTGKLGWHMTSTVAFISSYFLYLATIAMVGSVAQALGEEIGWRGLLTPTLVARFGFTGGSFLTGLIWAAWHMPLLLFTDYNNGTPWWFAMSCFCVMVLAISIILTWLRLRSASVWPCAILHASHNLFIQGFFTPLTQPRGALTPYVIDEFGVAVPLVACVFALFFWLKRGRAIGSARVMAPAAV